MSRVFDYLLNNKPNQFRINDFWLTFSLLSFLGFLYGLFVFPLENEIVEFAQIWAGKIEYLKLNFWYSGRLNEITLQAIIPAFLLKLGFSEWSLILLSSAVAVLIAFSSVGMTSYLLTRNPIVSILIPFILTHYLFYNAHFYGIVFPITVFIFGNLGMYLALLILVFFLFEKRLVAFYLIGFLPGLHIPWAIGLWLSVFVVSIYKRRIPSKKEVLLFVSGVCSFLVILMAANIYLLPDTKPISNPFINELKQYHSQIEKGSTELKEDTKKLDKNQHRVSSVHNPLFRNSPSLLKSIVSFYSYEILLILFLLCLFWFKREFFLGEIKGLVIALLSILLVVTLYKFIDEIFLGFSFLAPISPKLPALVERFLFNRWLNLNSIIAVVFMLSLLIYISMYLKNIISYILLIFILVMTFLIQTHIIPYHYDVSGSTRELRMLVFAVFNFVMVSGSLFLMIYHRKKNFPFPKDERINIQSNIAVYSIFIFLFLVFSVDLYGVINNRKFLSNKENSIIFQKAKDIQGGLIIAPYIHGRVGGNIQIRTGRAIYKMGGNVILNNPWAVDKKIDLFCSNETSKVLFTNSEGYEIKIDKIVKSCFENRSLEEWKYIGYSLYATSVLTKSQYKLKLPILKEDRDFILYKIPLSK